MPRRLACLVAAAAALPLAAAYRAVSQRALLSQRQRAGAVLASQGGSTADIGLAPVVAPLSLRHVGGVAVFPPAVRAGPFPASAPLFRLQSASIADAIADGVPTDVGSFARIAAGLAPYLRLSALQVSLEAWALFETSMSFAKSTASSLASASRGLQARDTRLMRSLTKIADMQAVKSLLDAVRHAKVPAAPATFEKRRRQSAQLLQEKASGMMGDLDREAEGLRDDVVEYAELHAEMRQRSGERSVEGAVSASEHKEEEDGEEEEEEVEGIEARLEKLRNRLPMALLLLVNRVETRIKAQELRVALAALAEVDVTTVKRTGPPGSARGTSPEWADDLPHLERPGRPPGGLPGAGAERQMARGARARGRQDRLEGGRARLCGGHRRDARGRRRGRR